ncbi:ABC transporter ATP-binding protein [Kocuria palustris]|uniref:ABC transporter ATP-binding protein n=1 Tax=Kocuria palustris TaxID=71999 RepID=UPI0021A40FCA|nr:ABC transporter ATP-binding protein [Kocuria palustris]MCT1833291.1 ABC transporter ATP-binding protein [Kocuria palustris]MDH5150859.1 ABC transporter ATP-binding protein [Kocuria palustris]
MPNLSEPAVDVRDLRMRYGSREVLRGIDLRIEPGTILGLLGPNGAGKTTTIEILEGFRRRSSGSVRVLGQDPERGGEDWRARLGIVLQDWRDHRRWRVRELLEHLGRYYRPYSSPSRMRPLSTDLILDQLGLLPLASTNIAKLSGGQRRRLDVAIGLVGNPELLFLDEPTVGFDPEARYEFHQVIRDISQTTNTAIILTTHDLAEAESLATRIAILNYGRIVVDDTPVLLKSRLTSQAIISHHWRGRDHRDEIPLRDVEHVVRGLLVERPDLSQLEVTRPTLETAYLNLVNGQDPGPAAARLGSIPLEESTP